MCCCCHAAAQRCADTRPPAKEAAPSGEVEFLLLTAPSVSHACQRCSPTGPWHLPCALGKRAPHRHWLAGLGQACIRYSTCVPAVCTSCRVMSPNAGFALYCGLRPWVSNAQLLCVAGAHSSRHVCNGSSRFFNAGPEPRLLPMIWHNACATTRMRGHSVSPPHGRAPGGMRTAGPRSNWVWGSARVHHLGLACMFLWLKEKSRAWTTASGPSACGLTETRCSRMAHPKTRTAAPHRHAEWFTAGLRQVDVCTRLLW